MSKVTKTYYVIEETDDYWKARYNSETNETRLEYDTAKALDTPLFSLVRGYIQFKGQDLDRVIVLLQKLKSQMEDQSKEVQ